MTIVHLGGYARHPRVQSAYIGMLVGAVNLEHTWKMFLVNVKKKDAYCGITESMSVLRLLNSELYYAIPHVHVASAYFYRL